MPIIANGITRERPGKISHYAMAAIPQGWLKCDGSAVSRATYAALYAAVGTTYGAGDGATTFNLPDLRGEFIRGLDDGRGVDAGRALGSAQAQDMQPHAHGVNDPGHAHGVTDPGHAHGVTDSGHAHAQGEGNTAYAGRYGQTDTGTATQGFASGAFSGTTSIANNTQTVGAAISINGNSTGVSVNAGATGITTANAGTTETRPRNVAMVACIKC